MRVEEFFRTKEREDSDGDGGRNGKEERERGREGQKNKRGGGEEVTCNCHMSVDFGIRGKRGTLSSACKKNREADDEKSNRGMHIEGYLVNNECLL